MEMGTVDFLQSVCHVPGPGLSMVWHGMPWAPHLPNLSNFRKYSADACHPENGQVLIGKGPWGPTRGTGGVRIRDPHHWLGGPCTRINFFRTRVYIDAQRPQYAKQS